MFGVDPYLSRTYVPEKYVCWDMVREAWLELTGFDIGGLPDSPAAALAVWRHFRRLPAPASPCIVLMRPRRAAAHVGLFWRRRVLHIGPNGGRYESLATAKIGFDQIGFYGAARPAD